MWPHIKYWTKVCVVGGHKGDIIGRQTAPRPDPLAIAEDQVLHPDTPYVAPHRIWTKVCVVGGHKGYIIGRQTAPRPDPLAKAEDQVLHPDTPYVAIKSGLR